MEVAQWWNANRRSATNVALSAGLALTKLLNKRCSVAVAHEVAAFSRAIAQVDRSHPPGEGAFDPGWPQTYIPGRRSEAGGFSELHMKLTTSI